MSRRGLEICYNLSAGQVLRQLTESSNLDWKPKPSGDAGQRDISIYIKAGTG